MNKDNSSAKKEYPQSGFESVQGRRWNMEDAHVNIDDLSAEFAWIPKDPKHSFYAVFDGHGGREAAITAEKIFLTHLLNQEEFPKIGPQESLKKAYAKTEEDILKRAVAESWSDGTTAITAFMVGKKLYVANLGDSEAVLGRRKTNSSKDAGEWEAVLLSEKHTPSQPAEAERLQKLGCVVMFGRVSGILAVSRGFGDVDFKGPHNQGVDFVSAIPYLNVIDVGDNDDFLIVACDGLWDVLTYEEAVEFIASQRWNGRSAIQAAENIVKESLDRKTMDNVTCLVIYLNEPKTNGK